MKYPFLPLPFLKLVVSPTINNWCSFLISTFAVSNIVNTSRIIYPWYVIVHHEALAAWWQWLWGNITISSGGSTPTRFKWLLCSDNLSTSSTIELFSLSLQAKKSSEVLYLLTWARAWNPNFSPRNISYVSLRFENVFGASTLNRLTELSRSYQNVYVRCSQQPQTTFEV